MADHAFLTLGQHCSEDSCRQLDFLPFKCPSCALPYCSEHWKPEGGHTCAKYNPELADNRIPSCPLCSTPVSFPLGTDPNIAMDTHLTAQCVVLNPHLASAPKPKPANECNAPRCKTKMIQPISCSKCRGRYCPTHRFERDHACKGAETVAAAGTGGAGVSGAKKLFGGLKGSTSKPGMAGLAALRRAQQAASSAASSSLSSSKPLFGASSQSSKPSTAASSSASSLKPAPPASSASARLGTAANPIVLSSDEDSDVQVVSAAPPRKVSMSGGKKVLAQAGMGGKVNKRALQEQESARKALEARAKKGLLTEDEKVRYATLQALVAKSGGDKKETCVVT
ncbi:hypothetical protein JCM10207_000072 [Rhodosporidiobolus poonsookiae]